MQIYFYTVAQMANVTEFWKITHMGEHEIIRIFMFSGLLIRTGHSFKIISIIFLQFKVLRMAYNH